MRILLLATDVFSKGGIPRYTRYQIRALRELIGDKNVLVLSLCSKNESSFEDSINIEYEGSGTSFKSKILFTCKTIDFVKKYKVDLIVNNHVHLTPISLICKKLFGTRYLMNAYGIEIWSGLRRREILSLKNSNGIIGDCKFILNYIQNNIDRNVKKYLLYDCTDVNKFKVLKVPEYIYEKYSIPKGCFKILTVATLYTYKGHDLIIEALSSSELRDKDIVYIIVGDGENKEYLKNLTKEKELEGKVLFLGRVSECDLVYLYNTADIFALISRFSRNEGEGLPLALLEANACGKPIIAGSEDGSAEAVEDGRNGFLIKNRKDIKDLIDKISILYHNSDLKEEMGKYGRQKVIRDFSYEKFKLNLAEILENTR
ncbi:MAG: hypothetical protein DRN95_04465 [Candidatus Hydrothermarchaeota archaeon]|nr:MAG: hypothetical protein DRN95_04465 [Candidatus Hydrothermarchaeota archaeon]